VPWPVAVLFAEVGDVGASSFEDPPVRPGIMRSRTR
jgi:hypothetical protein